MAQTLTAAAGDKEVQFINRQESAFPHLMRLCMDFNFRVVDSENQFRLTTACETITPAFASLTELESYVHGNMVDILHDYLFMGLEDATAH